jgi:hypothetical protein
MSDLTITGTDVAPVEIFEQWTAPAAETFSAGAMVRLDTSTGKVTGANATAAGEARTMGMAITEATYANETVTVVKRGIIDVGDALDSLDYDAAIYLSNTDVTLGDAAATVSLVVGRVVPGWGYTTADKLLHLDVRADL